MSDHLTTLQIALLKEQFDSFDKDGDGKLTLEDTAAIMRSLGQKPTNEEIARKHNEFDTNGDGIVDFPEFLEAMSKTVPGDDFEQEVVHLFAMMDKDRDGFLSPAELSHGLECGFFGMGSQDFEPLDEDEVNMIMGMYDQDKDGKLSLEEFSKMLKEEIYGNGLS